ncbi:hypothetical protein Hdeb2414_s0028g00699331 [Helianthus debilis subsp. tardiflorus]
MFFPLLTYLLSPTLCYLNQYSLLLCLFHAANFHIRSSSSPSIGIMFFTFNRWCSSPEIGRLLHNNQ